MIRTDFIAFGRAGDPILLIEAKYHTKMSVDWAARFRRNLLAHGLNEAETPFLLVTPDRVFLWLLAGAPTLEAVAPDYTADVTAYFRQYVTPDSDVTRLGGPARLFEIAVFRWLSVYSEGGRAGEDIPHDLVAILATAPMRALVGAEIRHQAIL